MKLNVRCIRAQELCKILGGRPGLPVPNSLYGLCGRKATLNSSLSPGDEDSRRYGECVTSLALGSLRNPFHRKLVYMRSSIGHHPS